MKGLKFISIITIIIGFAMCKSLKLEENPPFKIISATYKNWVGGQQGVRGTNVTIKFSSTKTIQFDSIYFDKKVAKLQTKNSNDNLLMGYFNTSTRRDLILDANPTKELKNTVPAIKKFPFKLNENEAVISYKINGKIKYYKIKSLQREQ